MQCCCPVRLSKVSARPLTSLMNNQDSHIIISCGAQTRSNSARLPLDAEGSLERQLRACRSAVRRRCPLDTVNGRLTRRAE